MKNAAPLREWILVLGIFILGFSAYFNVLSYPFVHDDIVFILNNPNIGDLSDWRSIFLRPQTPSGPSVIVPYWRPLLEIVYRLEYFFWGLKPAGYHFFNVLLHCINASLVFFLLKRLSPVKLFAPVVALVFLLHPVQSQAVACISGVSNLVFTFFALACFLAVAHDRFPAALVLYFLALLAKEQAAVILFLSGFYLWQRQGRQSIPAVGGFMMVTAAYLTLRYAVLGRTAVDIFENPYEFFLRMKAIPQIITINIRLLLWPTDLHYYRSVDILQPNAGFGIVLALLALGAVLLVRQMRSEGKPLAILGAVWFGTGLLPTLNIFPLIIEYSHVSVAEHFLYFPMIGFFLFIFILLESHLRVTSRRYFVPVLILVGLTFLILTVRQNRFWRGEVPLFERTLQFENLGRVHLLLGRAYYFNKNYDQAAAHYGQALEIMEDYAERSRSTPAEVLYKGFMKGIHFDIAHVFEDTGRPEQAIEHYTKAIALDPRDAALYNNLAVVYIRQGNWAQAKNYLEKALSVDPAFVPARQNLEQLLKQK